MSKSIQYYLVNEFDKSEDLVSALYNNADIKNFKLFKTVGEAKSFIKNNPLSGLRLFLNSVKVYRGNVSFVLYEIFLKE